MIIGRNDNCICGSGKKYKKCCGNGEHLFHFTSTWHLPKIMESGYLKLVTSNLHDGTWTEQEMYKFLQKQNTPEGMKEWTAEEIKQYGKGVVWLTNDHSPQGQGLEFSRVDKTEICIVIPKNDQYKKWTEWSRQQEEFDAEFVTNEIENGYNFNSWYISEKEIPLKDFLKCYNTITGKNYLKED
jgi:hypothetical protein